MSVEILAPGGSKEAVYAAIYSGADAVYTGMSRFSARAYADNPSVEELCRILDFAHINGKKIYLTVNTLLTEEELETELYDMLRPLYEQGLDAVIVQDFGVLDFIGEYFPDMAVHASTQMTLLTGEGANLLKPFGVTRVVPARELSIRDISRMRETTDLELEVFVHGAMCYCYSGQCMMSQAIGGRSGNRGVCAQPCRLPFAVKKGKPEHLLSTKDMCTLPRVGELIEAGVDSFKIEGRMKSPAYTAYTAHVYRTFADMALAGRKPDDRELNWELERLADLYNRGGFSQGYLFEKNKKDIVYLKKNGHFGVEVGRVIKVNRKNLEIRLERAISYQDVLEIRNMEQESVYEYTVKNGASAGSVVCANYKKGSPVMAGQKVYRRKNAALLQEIETMAEEGKKCCRRECNGHFRASCGEPVRLELECGNCRCEVLGPVAEKAKGRPVLPSDVEKRLRKTGESRFEFGELDVRLEEGIFLPLGSLAAMRRQAFACLEESLLAEYRRTAGEKRAAVREKCLPAGNLPKAIVRVTDFRQISEVKLWKSENADEIGIWLPLDEFAPGDWERAARELAGRRHYISLPLVLRGDNRELFLERWERFGGCFEKSGCAGAVLNSLEGLPVLEKMGWRNREVLADTGLYCWNRRAAGWYERMGICGRVYAAYGRQAVMTTEGCVFLNRGGCRKGQDGHAALEIQTPKKDEFLVVNYCDYCYNVIYEKKPGRQKPQWENEIPGLKFTFEDADEVREVLKQWSFLL